MREISGKLYGCVHGFHAPVTKSRSVVAVVLTIAVCSSNSQVAARESRLRVCQAKL